MLPIDFLYHGARQWPDAIAAEDGETALTYRQLLDSVEALAFALQELAPGTGRCIAVCAPNTLEHLVSILAILAAGHVWVPLNPRNGKAETDAIIAATWPVLVIADALCLDRFTSTEVRMVVSRPKGDESEQSIAGLTARFRHRRPRRAEPSREATQAIKFTSGSTGKPKGVLQSYRSWNACAAAILDAFRFAEDERFLAAAPITHGTSCFILPILSRGGRLVLLERPKPPEIVAAFSHGVTATYLTPTMIYMLMADDAARAAAFPALRHLIYSGAPMRPEQIGAAQSLFGACLEACYGQAEAPQIIAYMRATDFDDAANLAAAGHPGLGVEIGIMDDSGALLGRGEVGEIVVRGDLVMSGYLDNPEATAATIIDGWLHTGDLGFVDAQGLLFIKGRLREMIISGGFNIYPGDVERALGKHPAVHECAVFGVDDPKWGEAVHAAVELNPGHSVGETELIGHVKTLLDSVKAPKHIHIVAQLPRSAVGKVLRREAKAMALRDLADPPQPA